MNNWLHIWVDEEVFSENIVLERCCWKIYINLVQIV